MGNRKFSKKGISVPFVPLEHRLLDSEEWKNLTPKTKEIYIYMRRKFRGDNAEEIYFTYIDTEGGSKQDFHLRARRSCLKFGTIGR